jgi:hypothetical protein
MQITSTAKHALIVLAAVGCLSHPRPLAAVEKGFTSLFDGQTLNGWTMMNKKGDGYGVKDGILYCAKGGGGSLFTVKEYEDFILRLEYKLEDGSNNGIGIRAPLQGDPAFFGMEVQILDDTAPKYANLLPGQYNGSVYKVAPAKRGALKKVGEWNAMEIQAKGRQIKVTLNGKTIVNANLNDVTDPAVLREHPGMLRNKGHIGLLGHNDYVEFRNLRVKELPRPKLNNSAPEGFTRLFDGKTLENWKGLVEDPVKRAKMSIMDRALAQVKADDEARAHWIPVGGMLVFDGKGKNLCTAKDYGDFEFLVDWKIEAKGDSGVYLRGSPQVQIWDKNDTKPNPNGLGSGGLYNNKTNRSTPLVFADHVVGDWNTFRILMVGDKVHVYLNNQLVVRDTTLENYWERDKPMYPTGSIELQNHGNTLYFRNIYVREIEPKPEKAKKAK